MKVVDLTQRDKHKEAAVELLQDCIEEGFDTVIVLGFFNEKKAFKIKCSPMHDRIYVLGALAEATQHVLNEGYK